MDNTGLEPANAESNASTEAPKVDSEGTEVEGAAPATAADGDSGKPPRDRVQERIDSLTREKYEALSARDRERYQREALEARIAALETPAKPETVAPSDDYPTLESVGWDETEHKAAVAKWVREQAKTTVKSALAEERTTAQRDQTERDWERKQDTFIKSKPDYAEKVGSLPEYLMTPALAAEIKETGNPEIAYYLAEHADKLAEISRLPPKAMARELGRIEARIEAAKASPPPVSKAPAPVGRIDAGSSTSSVRTTDPSGDGLSDNEWFALERKRLARRAQND